MVINTESPRLTRLRKTVLELLLSNHPNDCMCCESPGDCALQELAYTYGGVAPEELAEINPGDALILGIANGDWLRVASRRGEVKVRAKVTDRSRLGSIFMTFHRQATITNNLTSDRRDPITGTPEYKSCAVLVEPWA